MMQSPPSYLSVLEKIPARLLYATQFGIERESLRVGKNGHISLKKHPYKLGAALTHPFITTDFSEALVEIVTPTFNDVEKMYAFINEMHHMIYASILEEDEMLWANSMPCILKGDQEVPLAEYGTSNIAQLKNLYRQGLGYRYGRSMQTIAGIHYNFSFSDDALMTLQQLGLVCDRNAFYMAGARNVLRLGWLLLYLFGASPAVCKSYLNSQKRLDTSLPHIDTDATFLLQYATSLRMSPLGYANNRTGSMNVSFNDIDSYLHDLRRLVSTDHPDYLLNSVDNPQINSKILQIENELYAYVRPKQPLLSNEERPITALKNRGIKYLEVRLIDINPFSPTGVTKQQLYFMRVFLTYCLLSESDIFLDGEQDNIRKNNENISLYGRDNKQKVNFMGKSMSIQDAYGFIADGLIAIAAMLDTVEQSDNYMKSISYYNEMIQNMVMTPSYQLLDFMGKYNYSFHVASKKLSESHADFYKKIACQPGALALQNAVATYSVAAKQVTESRDTVSFAKYIENYLCID